MHHLASGLIFILLLASSFFSSFALASDGAICKGTIPVFGFDGKAYKRLNQKTERFSFIDSKIHSLRVGLDPQKPFIEISPWREITGREFKENSKPALMLDFQTDGETWFSVRVRGRQTGFTQDLVCSVRFFPDAALDVRLSKKRLVLFWQLFMQPANAQASKPAMVRGEELLGFLKNHVATEKMSCAIDRILDNINPKSYHGDKSVAGKNMGLESHFRKIIEDNRCFQRTASEFWKNAEPNPRTLPAAEWSPWRKPSLFEKAGEGRFSEQKPGWLWQKAMKSTGANPNIAMSLLAMCMHDDISISISTFIPVSERKNAYGEWVVEQDSKINELREKLHGMESSSTETQLINAQIEKLEDEKKFKKLNIDSGQDPYEVQCPDGLSTVFAPQAVDPILDLPTEMKSAIAQAQRPGGNTENLPAKSYHFMGGANIGCELAKCGVEPEQAAKIASALASAYRAIRLCPTVQRDLKELSEVADKIDVLPESPEFPARLREEQRVAFDKKKAKDGMFSALFDIKIPTAEIMDLHRLGEHSAQYKTRLIELREKGLTLVNVEYDAAKLYEKWYLSKASANICTTLRPGGPDGLLELDPMQGGARVPTSSAPMGTLCKIPGWSAERCENARKKLATWDADFQWTAKQHEIGARWGASVCRPEPKGARIDDKLCATTGSSPATPRNPPEANVK